MVFVAGLCSKIYWDQLAPGLALPRVPCPTPSCYGSLLRGHGWHERYLSEQRVRLRRLRCPRCRVSHVLLPEDVCAYRDLSFPVLEAAMAAAGPKAAAASAGESSPAAVRRARRWRRGSTWVQLSLLLPVAGTVWERIAAVVGEGVGQLLRLRHWLWSHLGYLLGGATTLFRRGRPRDDLGGDSP